ncbi:MAG TPA: serine hydrolase domain-containing protein [Bryobacteraceae bacterium]|nr:serine hydrolase domain-containing protein [Bryobacteraceae bacterium]
MKAITILLLSSLTAFAAANFSTDKVDPVAAGMDQTRLAAIPALLKQYVEANKVAGIVTLVARHGVVAQLSAVGYRELEDKQPMKTDTIFRIMSMTKPITCAGVMILVDEGKISLLDPVEKYLPEFKGIKLNPCGTRVGYSCQLTDPTRAPNVLDLMIHTSGVGESSRGRGGTAAPPASLAEHISSVQSATLLFDPGSAWNYSNFGIATLGRLIEVVAKVPYERFMAERIFQPLGMKDTTFFLPSDKQNRLAALYTYEPDGLKRVNRNPFTYPSPDSGLMSTAGDLARFSQAMLNKGTLNGARILSPPAVEAMTRSWTGDMKAGYAPGVGQGFGFEVVREALGTYRYTSIGSYEKAGAFRTYYWVDPAKDMLGIILMQRTNGGAASDTADETNAFMAMAAAAIDR